MKIRFMLCVALAIGLSSAMGAQEYKIVIPQLSPATVETYTKLTQAIFDATGAKYTIEVLPFARAVYMIEAKQADLLLCEIENPDKAKAAALKVDTSTTPLFQLVFVLYANKAKPISVDELKKGNAKKWVIETDIAHTDYFPFATVGSAAFDTSLKKVDAGRVDGYIFAQPSTDGVLKKLELKNVSRTFYDFYTAKVILQKGARGGPIDKVITAGLEKIKANGTFDTIMAGYIAGASKYNDWQP